VERRNSMTHTRTAESQDKENEPTTTQDLTLIHDDLDSQLSACFCNFCLDDRLTNCSRYCAPFWIPTFRNDRPHTFRELVHLLQQVCSSFVIHSCNTHRRRQDFFQGMGGGAENLRSNLHLSNLRTFYRSQISCGFVYWTRSSRKN
jgi:hypothetical protein